MPTDPASLFKLCNLVAMSGWAVLLAGWVHYLAFDLLTGAWQVDQAQALALPRPLVALCLLITFMFGPAGWLAFMLLRRIRRVAP